MFTTWRASGDVAIKVKTYGVFITKNNKKERAMKKIGWIGTGVMGKSMCIHILKKGYPLSVYNRTKEKAGELCSRAPAGSPLPEMWRQQAM